LFHQLKRYSVKIYHSNPCSEQPEDLSFFGVVAIVAEHLEYFLLVCLRIRKTLGIAVGWNLRWICHHLSACYHLLLSCISFLTLFDQITIRPPFSSKLNKPTSSCLLDRLEISSLHEMNLVTELTNTNKAGCSNPLRRDFWDTCGALLAGSEVG
jgi:hypothetical protein